MREKFDTFFFFFMNRIASEQNCPFVCKCKILWKIHSARSACFPSNFTYDENFLVKGSMDTLDPRSR